MTCVAGVVRSGRVWIGADSAATTDDLVALRQPKVFQVGGLTVGFAGSYRAAQVLRFGIEFPPDTAADPLEWLSTAFVDVLRAAHRRAGAMRLESGLDACTTAFLVGYRGGLYDLDGEYAVTEVRDYAAVGAGASLAMGVLAVTSRMRPARRVELALQTAEKHCPSVRGPFLILES